MPELPEVETVRKVIKPQISGQTVRAVRVINEKVIAYPDPEEFAARLLGQEISGMSRRGKFLSIDMDNKDKLYLHLRMTGCLLVTPPEYEIEKHTHLILELSGGKQIRYIDQRRFGRFWYIKKGEDASITGIGKLGPEPSSKKLTAEYLKEKCACGKRAVKEALLDQKVVAGIGNIYADETLFVCGIHPQKECRRLTDNEWRLLAEKIPETIRWAIRKNRISPEDYLEGKGEDYRNTPYLRVYGRAGEPCVNCGNELKKITIGGRSSVYCPMCQKQ